MSKYHPPIYFFALWKSKTGRFVQKPVRVVSNRDCSKDVPTSDLVEAFAFTIKSDKRACLLFHIQVMQTLREKERKEKNIKHTGWLKVR